MTTRKLASIIAKIEGKKSQAKIGDIMEVLSVFRVLFYSNDVGEDVRDWLNADFKISKKRYAEMLAKLNK